MSTLVLVHGGLWDEPMDADRFWYRPGIVEGLRGRGFAVHWPDRLRRPPDWSAEAQHLAAGLVDLTGPVVLVAGSNGCSAAVRLALREPDRIAGLLLAWPATAGDPAVDERTRAGLAAAGAPAAVIEAMLAGGILRGVADDELATLTMAVGVLPSAPHNPVHQRRTVDALRGRWPRAVELSACVESPRPDFAAQLDTFLDAVSQFVAAIPLPWPGSPAGPG